MGQTIGGSKSRTSSAIVAAAVGAIGAAGWPGASDARAGLFVDLRLTSLNNDPSLISDPKVIPSLNIGDTLTFNVVVRVSGTNSVQQTGSYDGAFPNDTRNDDTFQALCGSFASFGSIKGNFDPTNQNGNWGTRMPPFDAAGSQNGVAQDFDSDGDLDLGTSDNNPNQYWIARTGNAMATTVSKRNAAPQTRIGLSFPSSSPNNFFVQFEPYNSSVPDTHYIDATSAEMLVGELTWYCTAMNGSDVSFNFIPRPDMNAATALWFEDGAATGKSPGAGTLTVGAPVGLFIPEPTSAAVAGVVSLGLLARRKREI
jgi:hypothetical protein